MRKGEMDEREMSRFDLASVKEFSAEVRTEFGKVAWPDKKHTAGSTFVVLILVTMMSFYLGAVDFIIGKIISTIIR